MDVTSDLVKAMADFIDFEFDIWHTAHFEDEGFDGNYGMMTMIHTTEETSRGEMQNAVNKVVKEYGYHDGCGHSHDCCGCEFFAGATVAPIYDGTTTFIIYESYGRNV